MSFRALKFCQTRAIYFNFNETAFAKANLGLWKRFWSTLSVEDAKVDDDNCLFQPENLFIFSLIHEQSSSYMTSSL